MKQGLVNFGVLEKKVYVTGIPMSSRFLEDFNDEKIYEMFNLDSSKKVILFFGGGEFGLGMERTTDILKSFIEILPNLQIVAVSGKNEKMKKTFDDLVKSCNANNRVRVLGFTDKVPELMHISSLVVTKPGGLTTTESLASFLPMVIINPIPGQEEENAEFLESNGVGVWIRKNDNPKEVITNLFNSPERLEKMRQNSKLLAKRNSTSEICRIILN